MLHSGYWNLVLVTLFIAEYTQHPILFPSKGQCLLCLSSRLFSRLTVGLVFLAFWTDFEAPSLSVVLGLINANLNSQCDNFEP
jgi:hypothetical protein